jgi:acyl carrier protein
VLRLAEIGIHDSFFALGGHSLHAVQVTARIRDRFGVSLPLRRVFEGPTIAELGVAIAQAKAELQSEDELSRFLEELEGLSEVEVQTRLASGASDGTRDARE